VFIAASHRSHAPVGLETLPKTFAESPYAAFAGRAMVSAAPAWRRGEEEDIKSVFRSRMSRGFFGKLSVTLSVVSDRLGGMMVIDPRSPRGEPLESLNANRGTRRDAYAHPRRLVYALKFSPCDGTSRNGRRRRRAPRRARDRPTKDVRDPRFGERVPVETTSRDSPNRSIQPTRTTRALATRFAIRNPNTYRHEAEGFASARRIRGRHGRARDRLAFGALVELRRRGDAGAEGGGSHREHDDDRCECVLMTPRPASRLVEVCCFYAFIHSIFNELFCHIALVSYHIYIENERNFYISTCPNPNPRGSFFG